jgi:VanZ family protein
MALPAVAVHRALSRGVLALTVLVSLAVLFTPGDGVPSAPPGVDKLVHLALFAALASAGCWAGARPRVLAVLLVAYALVSEVVQALAPLNRSGSLADAVADLIGVALGLLVGTAIGRTAASR